MALKLRTVVPTLRAFDGRAVKPPPKEAAPLYQSPEYRAWREAVITAAGGRCEAIDRGARCRKAAPLHRLFADHKVEVRDGGPLFDPANGQCLCGAHHGRKTARARADRRSS